jgi:Protein of unknown function (DUF2281)
MTTPNNETNKPSAQDAPLWQMFNDIYEANHTGQDHIQAKVTPLIRQVADSLLKQQLIERIEIDDTQIDVMTLYLANPPPPQFSPVNYLQEFPTEDPEERQILQKLQDPDPNVRIQGITALTERCLELKKLPPNLQAEVLNYAEHPATQSIQPQSPESAPPKYRQAGTMKGMFVMADDFDVPLEDLKDCM